MYIQEATPFLSHHKYINIFFKKHVQNKNQFELQIKMIKINKKKMNINTLNTVLD